MRPRRLGVLTTGRQDWGILRSICTLARADAELDLRLFVGGMALSHKFGNAVKGIEEDGFIVNESLAWAADDDASGVHHGAANAVAMTGDALVRQELDAFLLVGDRFETMSAAVAATVLRVPLVHLHGGEETEGAFDNALRHAITKLAHLHLVSHPTYARRVIAMGEEPQTVHVVGAPGLDNLRRSDLPSRDELEARLGLKLRPPVVLVTLHPATLGGDPAVEAAAVCDAMDAVDTNYVITLPNNDPGAAAVRAALEQAAKKPGRVAVEALGERFYWSLLSVADAMLGNSSSAIVEAPAVALPAVNVGDRQRGRLRAPNVIDVDANAAHVVAALRAALEPGFRKRIGDEARAMFGDGHAGERVLTILREWSPARPPVKRFAPYA